MKISLLNIVLFCIANLIFAQETNPIVQQRMEYWMERNQMETMDLTHLQEIWEYHLENPLNLNTVQKEELSALDLFSDIQMEELLNHRSKYGSLLTVYELQTLPTWDTAFIQVILPFITLNERADNPPITWYELTHKGKLDVLTRFQQPFKKESNVINPLNQNQGTSYLGSNAFYLTRMRYTYQQRVSLGITAEKDVGEPFFKLANKNGFDFYAMHLQVKPGKIVKNLIIGDFHVQIGQGLNCWTSFALGKSLEITTSKKNAQVIRPHTSTDENRFFRGVASEIAFKRCTFLLFTSHNRKDASMNTDTMQQISSILTSGYHRTENELARKDVLKEICFGGYIRYDIGAFHVGCASVFFNYSPGLNKKKNLYNQFDFRGENNHSTSIDYSYTYKNLLIFGELAYVHFSKKTAGIQGVMLAIDAKTSVSFLFRKYDKEYETPYNAGFSEGNTVQNESGFYVACTRQLSKYWNIQLYSDYFQFPWLKQNICLPSKGLENCMQITWKPTKNIEFYVRYRNQMKEQNSSVLNEGVKFLSSINQTNLRYHLSYKINDFVEIRSRLEGVSWKRADKNPENGILFFQDINLTTKKMISDVIMRFILFDTDSYASRIYSFESSPAYQYSSPAFYGKGLRAYILCRVSIWKKIDFWLKAGNTLNLTKDNSSEYWIDLLDSNTKEINIQLRWKI